MANGSFLKNANLVSISEEWIVNIKHNGRWKYKVYICFHNVSNSNIPINNEIYHFTLLSGLVLGERIRCANRTINGIRQGNCTDYQININRNINAGSIERVQVDFHSNDLSEDEGGHRKIVISLPSRIVRAPHLIKCIFYYPRNFKHIKVLPENELFSNYTPNDQNKTFNFEFEKLPAHITLTYKVSVPTRIYWKIIAFFTKKAIEAAA